MSEKLVVEQKNIELESQEIIKNNDIFKRKPYLLPLCLYGGLAFFIFVIFGIFLYINNVYPFGNACISSYDLLAQIVPFIEHFYDVFEGRSSLFYSYAAAGGVDLFGSLAYCCVSPFTFIFLLFGRGNVYYATSIVLPLKIACVSFAGLYYVRKRFKNIPIFLQLALALSYAFCGYLFVSNTYINWVDLLIYLPFLALGFKQIVDTRKKSLFVVSLCLMIYTTFSISSFSLFIIYPIIVLYALIVCNGYDRKEVLTDVVLALLLAIFFALPILLPSLRAFLVSGRKSGMFENLDKEYSASALYSKVSYIFTDGLTLFFTLMYFIKNGLKRPIDRFLALAGILLLVPIFFDESMNLLNFGSYMSYALRFGFLNGFYFFFVAGLYFNEFYEERLQSVSSHSVLQTSSNKKYSVNLYVLLMLVLIVGFIVGLSFLVVGIQNESFTQSFGGRFAHSLGGLEATAIVFGCMALIGLLGTLFVKYKKFNTKILSFILLLSVCVQTVFYGGYLVVGNYYNPSRYTKIGALTNYVNKLENDGAQTRIKMNENFITACYPFVFKTNGFSIFSSVVDSTNFVAPTIFGYSGNGKNSMKSYGGKFFGDCIFGYKYLIVNDAFTRSYLKELDVYDQLLDKNGNIIDVGSYKLFENEYAFPHAFAVPGGVSEYEKGSLAYSYDSLLKALGGENFGIEWIDVEISEEPKDPGVFHVKIPVNDAGNYFFVSEFSNLNNISYTRSKPYNEENAKKLIASPEFSLGYGSSGSYNIYLKSSAVPLSQTKVENACKAFRVTDEQVKKISKLANEQQVDFNIAPNVISVNLSASKGEKIFLNYVALDGHTPYVNGKKVDFIENELNFMYFELEEGENNVKIVYQSPYVKFILIGIALAIIFAVAYYFLVIRGRKFVRTFKNTIFYLGLAVGALVLVFFFVMPVCVCAYKSIKIGIQAVMALF
ncbi:MAG: YfhO family protein [Clostridia bacterium]|nr:YfhO family protein [Clostridia bacterium]